MKTIPIRLDVPWSPNLLTWTGGERFREPQWDALFADLGNHFGALKVIYDAKASLAGFNTWTQGQTFQPASPFVLMGLHVNREVHFIAKDEDAEEAARAGLIHREVLLPDANVTVTPNADVFIVPETTGARIYKFGGYGGENGRRLRVLRPRVGDFQDVEIQDSAGVTVGVFPAGSAGSMDLEYRSSDFPRWKPRAWTGAVVSRSEVV